MYNFYTICLIFFRTEILSSTSSILVHSFLLRSTIIMLQHADVPEFTTILATERKSTMHLGSVVPLPGWEPEDASL